MFSNNEEKKLDWMYKGPNALVDRESYLLGRSIDKTLEELNKEESAKAIDKFIVPPKNHVEHECIPPSIRDYNKIVKSEQVDLQAKLQEDPLVLIKRQEEETRRQFLQNPVQLKKLQEAMEAQLKKRTNHLESKTDKKLKKKLKKLSKQLGLKNNFAALKISRETQEDEAILDTILMHKFNSLKNELSEEDLKNILLGNYSDSEDSQDTSPEVKRRKKRSDISPEVKRRKRSRSDTSPEVKRRERSRSISDSRSERKSKQSTSSKKYDNDIEYNEKRAKESLNHKERYRTMSNKNSREERKKLSEEEKEALRKRMMEQAAVRNSESAKKFRKYKEDNSKPEVLEEHSKDFIRNQLLKSANSSSVADRIKANVNNIQRSKFSMESNFLK